MGEYPFVLERLIRLAMGGESLREQSQKLLREQKETEENRKINKSQTEEE